MTLDQQQSHYLTKVLRLKVDQHVTVFNGIELFDFAAIIKSVGKSVELYIENSLPNQNESPVKTCVFQALSKNDHCDFTIQKCTELGINTIIIFNSERTQSPLKSNRLEKKLNHWQRIAQNACEQSGRCIVPKISFYNGIKEALSVIDSDLRIMLDFDGSSIHKLFSKSPKKSKVSVLLGAEGGLSFDEIQFAEEQYQFNKVRLGPRVLRTETAAITALSLIQMLAGDLN